jgi:hypothetical protein
MVKFPKASGLIKGVWVHILGERLSNHIESLGVITPMFIILVL